MSTAIRTFLFLALLLLSGCLPSGVLYTNKVTPYSRDFKETPVGTKQCVIRDHRIKEPVTGFGMYTEWTSGYLKDEARRAGISEIYYVDKQTLSFLFGIYKRESLIIHGD